MADPPGMKRVVWGTVGIEVGSRLGAREPVSELDPEVLSTPDCATARPRRDLTSGAQIADLRMVVARPPGAVRRSATVETARRGPRPERAVPKPSHPPRASEVGAAGDIGGCAPAL